jgi:tRNA pseudouridine13 synthase
VDDSLGKTVAELPFLTADIPPVAGEVRARLEDFVVEEIPAYLPSGKGTHSYLWIEKRGVSTLDAVRRIARSLSRNENDIGYAGMKDSRGITRQYLSIEHCPEEKLTGLKIPGVEILSISRHTNKLKIGHLKGNRFRILLRGADADAADDCRKAMDILARRGVPNYFGRQRFGRRGDTARIGLALIGKGAAEAARLLFGCPASGDPPAERASREAFENGDLAGALKLRPRDGSGLIGVLEAAVRGADWDKAMRRLPKRLRLLYLNAAQSEPFNRVLARRIATLDVLLPGDIAFIHSSGAVFRTIDPAAEAQRVAAFEISPTGPMFGCRMLWPDGDQDELERSILAEYGLKPENLSGPCAKYLPGERRPLRVPMSDHSVEITPAGILLTFSLPAGAYATSIIREIVKKDV